MRSGDPCVHMPQQPYSVQTRLSILHSGLAESLESYSPGQGWYIILLLLTMSKPLVDKLSWRKSSDRKNKEGRSLLAPRSCQLVQEFTPYGPSLAFSLLKLVTLSNPTSDHVPLKPTPSSTATKENRLFGNQSKSTAHCCCVDIYLSFDHLGIRLR